MSSLEIDEENPLQMFLYALRAPESKRQYPKRLKVLLDYLTKEGELSSDILEEQCKEFLIKGKENPRWTNNQLMEFILFQNERAQKGEIVYTTIRNYLKATKLFLEMNSDTPIINWKRITKCLPTPRNAASDRPPKLEELKSLMDYPDRRIRPIILSMVSGGFRIGSWDYLKWKHVVPIRENSGDTVIAAKIIIYAGEPEEYFTFITPEAYNALNEWMLFRKSSGEEIDGESWLMRDIWSTTDFESFKNNSTGLVKFPKKLKGSGIKSLIERAMRAQGLAEPLPEGVKRRDWKSGHGYRKFFKTKAEQVMRPANVELLSGRDIGVSQSYYKPTQNELLEDYLKAIPLLTIKDEYRLNLENKALREKNNDTDYIIRAKLLKKDEERDEMKQQIQIIIDTLVSMADENGKDKLAKLFIEKGIYHSVRSIGKSTEGPNPSATIPS